MNRTFFLLMWPISVFTCLALWWVPGRGPMFDTRGDLYRGWPLPYGVDQGAVSGDGYAFFVTRFQPVPFVIDGLAAILITILVFAVCSAVLRAVRSRSLDRGARDPS